MAATFDAVSTGTSNTGELTLTFSHTQGSLGNTGLIVVCAEGNENSGGSTNQRITGVTYNGVAMTLVDSDENTAASSCSVALYELHGSSVPIAGTYDVVVSYQSADHDSSAAGCMSFRGIKPQAREATAKINANGTNPLAQSVTTLTANALVVAAYGSQNTPDATVNGTGETRAFRAVPGSVEQSECCGFYKTVAIPGSTSTSLTVGNPEAEALILASFAIAPPQILPGEI